jgi:hypothetical protein
MQAHLALVLLKDTMLDCKLCCYEIPGELVPWLISGNGLRV